MKCIITLFGILMISAMLLNEAPADDKSFSISIVGQNQSNITQRGKDGLPVVIYPRTPPNQNGFFGVTSANSFFVVIQNIGTVPVKITMNSSDWYDRLQFKITDRSGKTYSVIPTPLSGYSKNALEMWTFQAGGMRVMPVDFTWSEIVPQRAGWEGLPPHQAVPEIAAMTATFRYYDPEGKQVTVSSRPTEVELSSK